MRSLFALILVLIAFGYPAPEARADAAALWARLKQGGAIALIRHAEAPGGAGDPAGFKPDDCSTQRNLSETGRSQARQLGERFRANGVAAQKVLASEWCRTRETASLMALGPVEEAPTFNNAYVLHDRRQALTEGARAFIAGWKGPGTLVIVTHGANILPLTGIQPGEAEIVVVAPDPGAPEKHRTLGRIPLGS